MSDDSLVLKVVTIALAVYGALLSTAVAVWNIYRQITERGRLRITVSIADMFSPGVGTIATNKLWHKVANVGRQPIWLSQIDGGYRNGKHFLVVVPQQLPMKLEPGETFDDASSDAANLHQRVDGSDRVTFLGTWDTIGRIHKLRRRRFWTLRNELRQLK